MREKWFLSILFGMALLLVLVFAPPSVPALAGTDPDELNADGASYSFTEPGSSYTLTSDGELYQGITITCGNGVSVTLVNVNIIGSLSFSGTGNTLTLVGTNQIIGENYPGVMVTVGSELTINGTGSLTAWGAAGCAGVGGMRGEGGTITINSGSITARGGGGAAGIGGGNAGNGGTITINGGNVTAYGGGGGADEGGGAGIGGGGGNSVGIGGNGGTITINGGAVTASGGGGGGAGIGGGGGGNAPTGGVTGGPGGNGGNVTISGGNVIATSTNGAGIGGGSGGNGDTGGPGGNGSNVTISGGTVIATSTNGAGIGGGCAGGDNSNGGAGANVTISGGTVKTSGYASIGGGRGYGSGSHGSSGTLENTGGNNVYLTTVMLEDVSTKTAVTSLTATWGGSPYSYGINDVFTDDTGKLYLYLPEGANTTAARTVSGNYLGLITTTDDHTASDVLSFSALPVITIITQPLDITVTEGSISGSLSVTASVTQGATLSYQWYSNTINANSGGDEISGATDASFTIPTTLTTGSYYYYCVVSATDGAASVPSSVATVTVNPPPTYLVTVNNGSGGGSFAAGTTVTITANDPPSGKVFDKWTTTDGVIFADENAMSTSFVMPAKAVTVTATYKDMPALTVNNGSGGGSFAAGTIVTITANDPPGGYRFKEWSISPSITFTDGTSAVSKTAKFTMPDADVTATAIYESLITGVNAFAAFASPEKGMVKGGTYQFGAIVYGTDVPQTVTWSISGATSPSSTINASGSLAVGTDETAASLTITATSTADTSKSGSVTVTVVDPIYQIQLITADHTFPEKQEGYAMDGTLSRLVLLQNTGNQPTGELTVALSGANPGSFTLSKTTISTLGVNSMGDFTVSCKTGLNVGTHTATVTISGNNGISASINVSFTVTADTSAPNFSSGGATKASIKPKTAVFDKNPASSDYRDVTLTLESGNRRLCGILLGGKKLAEGRDYKLNSGKVTFNKEFLSTLAEGEYQFVFDMSGGTDPVFTVTIINTKLPAADLPIPFRDVSADDWFWGNLLWAYEAGLMSGVSHSDFGPHMPATRGMIAVILYRLEGSPTILADNHFTDVAAGRYYTDAVIWAAGNNIISGYGNGRFEPDTSITREQLAATLMNYAKYKGYDVSARADLERYSDSSSISDWAWDAISWANALGLLQGNRDELMPKGNAERCQVAAILQRFVQYFVK